MLIYVNITDRHKTKLQFGTSQNIITHLDRTFKEIKNDIKNGKAIS